VELGVTSASFVIIGTIALAVYENRVGDLSLSIVGLVSDVYSASVAVFGDVHECALGDYDAVVFDRQLCDIELSVGVLSAFRSGETEEDEQHHQSHCNF
jgi:hypothetical protein